MRHKLIVMGASTGGPGHLHKILEALPTSFSPSIVIAQHINHIFVDGIVESLSSTCNIPVFAGCDGMQITANSAVIVKGPFVNEIRKDGGAFRLSVLSDISDDYSPSIDKLFMSVARLGDLSNVMGILLTGIGSDGARGLLEMRRTGALTLAESEKTSIVYGMPRAAIEIGAADTGDDLDKIIEKIIEFGR